MNELNGVFAIILASGQSSRMGTPKLLLPWHGLTIMEHTLQKVSMLSFEGIKVVIPTKNEKLRAITSMYPCESIINTSPHLGIGHSLSLAIRSLPSTTKAAIVFLGDQPKIHADDIQGVLGVFKQLQIRHSDNPNKSIIQVKYRDGKSGHPILFSPHFFHELISLEGDQGGKGIIQKNEQFVYQSKSVNNYPKDIDTPNDYHQLINEDIC
ncbi:nucleotidyltransferase family protein [Bacillus sp. FJAT-49736]|uniref:nucleotidyltransferase family protein n=1 Tax=Bacillus sp. FJAT-49736 TaxID=2833582 RepID=UPI001BC8E460|nr:nucleotidyltransferase family protein [Bacillus sp. FJAT-49736]MBS4174960.1 nucleotidyltransferase family protein [Bacillus sp. FJAT-49736]